MEVTKFWTKTKVIILLVLLAIIGAIVGFIFYRRGKLKKEYMEIEKRINENVVYYLSLEGIELEEDEYRKINIKEIYKHDLAKNDYQDDCKGYSIAENSKKGYNYSTYLKCKSIYTTPGYGSESTKKENKTKTQTENDTIKPVISLIGDSPMTIGLNVKFKDPGATANDNIDGDLTKKIKVTGEVDITKEGEYKLVYSVSDKAGNKASKTRVVKVSKSEKTETKDTIAPVITFKNSLVQTVCLGSKVDISKDGIYGYTAYDDTDGNITDKVKVTGNLDNIMGNSSESKNNSETGFFYIKIIFSGGIFFVSIYSCICSFISINWCCNRQACKKCFGIFPNTNTNARSCTRLYTSKRSRSI